MTTTKNLFVEFHVLRSHAPSNLNRDDMGSPKSALLGGVRRLRISSQCLKRTWRTSAEFRGDLAEEALGVRTQLLPALVLEALASENAIDVNAREGLVALMASLGKKAKEEKADDDENEEGATAASSDGPELAEERPETPHLLYLSKQEIREAIAFAKNEAKALADAFVVKKNKRSADSKKIEALRDKLQKHWAETCKRNAVDVALFGRFMTSDELKQIEAAMQVAHAIGTQKLDLEYDYFTAVDDERGEAGAGHLGETEFAQSVLYEYACCDVAQLRGNLGEDEALAGKALGAVARAMARAVPTGKKNSTAPNSPADYIEVVLRHDQPVSLVNAFLKPVRPDANQDAMEVSIKRLRERAEVYEQAYGQNDVVARMVLSPLVKVEGAYAGLGKLVEDVGKKVDGITTPARSA